MRIDSGIVREYLAGVFPKLCGYGCLWGVIKTRLLFLLTHYTQFFYNYLPNDNKNINGEKKGESFGGRALPLGIAT